MGILQRPRAAFKGVFTVNPPTANNDKVGMTINQDTIEVNQPDTPPPLNDAELRLWMMKTRDVQNPDGSSTIWLNSYYNYFGDGSFAFSAPNGDGTNRRTSMTSGTLSNGNILTPGQDSFLNGTVEILGDPFFDKPGTAKMLDLDPTGIFNTQIFSGQFRVVQYDANGNAFVMLSGQDPTRAYIRCITGTRNIAPGINPQLGGAAYWQLALPLSGLTFQQPEQPSQVLSALQTAAQNGIGLVVRFVTYYTDDGMPEDQLAQLFAASGYNKAIYNPSVGLIVGTIGAWSNANELGSTPTGRWLYPNASIPIPTAQYETVPLQRGPMPLVKRNTSDPTPVYFLQPGPFYVDTVNQNIVLDFGMTIPEDTGLSNPPAPGDLQKTNYGTMRVTVTSKGVEQNVTTLPYSMYDRTAYELTGGIIELPYPASLTSIITAPDAILKFYADATGNTPILQEIAYPSIATDDYCMYLMVGETVTTRVQVLLKGVPAANVTLTPSQYAVFNKGGGDSGLVKKAILEITAPEQPIVQIINSTITTDANGYADVVVKGVRPGIGTIRYQGPGDTFNPTMGYPPIPNMYFGYCFYNSFRVLPNDNYDNIPDSQITWDLVYREVMRFYYLIYPGMFARLDLQNESTARSFASVIRAFTAKNTWDSTSYMPVTRELSDGKRKLLQRWCALNE